MTSASDTAPTPPSAPAPLGADDLTETIPYGNLDIVSTYGVPQAEYAAIHKASGLFDALHRGVLEIAGKDRHAFLNNFLTNQTWSKETKTGMAPNTGVYAFLLSGKGRVVADMNVLELGDRLYLETDRRLLPDLKTTLEKYVFTEKVTFTPRPDVRRLSLLGPESLGVLQDAGAALAELADLASRAVSLFGTAAIAFRDDLCGVPGYHLLLSGDPAPVWQGLTEPYAAQTNKRRLRPVGWAMFNTCRIEAGRSLYGIDFTDESLPAETGLFDRAVSVTKGCYLGQEIVARMYARQQVAKQLVGLRVLEDALPTAGAPLLDPAGQQVGMVTSSTLSPLLGGAAICLATVKKGHTTPGTPLTVPAENTDRKAVVTDLPFLPAPPTPDPKP